MLYTFSQANYEQDVLAQYLTDVTAQDAVVLWQDGVLLALKHADYFSRCKAEYVVALEPDISARHLTALWPQASQVRFISIDEFVRLTERFFPQIAL